MPAKQSFGLTVREIEGERIREIICDNLLSVMGRCYGPRGYLEDVLRSDSFSEDGTMKGRWHINTWVSALFR